MAMVQLNHDYIEAVKELANNGPYFMLLSVTMKKLDIGRSVFEIHLENKHLQAFGFVHGGVVAPH